MTDNPDFFQNINTVADKINNLVFLAEEAKRYVTKTPTGETTYLTQVLTKVIDVAASLWPDRNKLIKVRSHSCLCYRTNLLNGTASPHCSQCVAMGLEQEARPEIDEVIKSIIALRDLPLNWDGIHGKPVWEGSISLARDVVGMLGPHLNVSANSDGSIELLQVRDRGQTVRRITVEVGQD